MHSSYSKIARSLRCSFRQNFQSLSHDQVKKNKPRALRTLDSLINTAFVDMRHWKTKHAAESFLKFPLVLRVVDRIKIHQSEPDCMT